MARGGFKPEPDDLVIVVMGPTGSGKTNFINKLTGNAEQQRASNLKSDTQNVAAYPISYQGSRVVVVDTPGFDDTYRQDSDILRAIADWLIQKYPDGTTLKIAGIIYVHRISDNRMSGSTLKNLQMFGRLCGNIPLRRTRLVTTMWDHVRDQGVARQRETQLKTDFWRVLTDGGATVHRFHNTPESAWGIVSGISPADKDGELLLQEELVKQEKHLNETEAGKAIYNRLQKLLADQRNTLKELAKEAKLENDPKLAQTWQEEYEKINAQLQQMFEEMKELKIPPFRRFRLWVLVQVLGRKSRAKVVELDYTQA